jgi:Predicted P-loop-containing kinase
MIEKKEIVIVTGMSGAGKTTAMTVFENMEFQCIDNYPVMLLEEFGDLLKKSNYYNRIALAVNLNDAIKAIQTLHNMDWLKVSIVFLDAKDDVILKRYKFTRRTHPLLISNKASSLVEAIQFERKIAEPIQYYANNKIDTSNFNLAKLQDELRIHFNKEDRSTFRISLVSFGYKHGIPKDADLLFDVRFLPNPYYIDELRNNTGNDSDVYNYVMAQTETKEFITRLTDLLDYYLVNFEKEGKMHLVIGFGCTGGQHRSVSLVNYFSKHYSKQYLLHTLHRDAKH